MKISKSSIETTIIEGDLSKAIRQLIKLSSSHDPTLNSSFVQQAARLSALEKRGHLGILSTEEKSKIRNEINLAIITSLAKIPDHWEVTEPIVKNQDSSESFSKESVIKTGSIYLEENVEAEDSSLISGDIDLTTDDSNNSTGDITIGKGSSIKRSNLKSGDIKKKK